MSTDNKNNKDSKNIDTQTSQTSFEGNEQASASATSSAGATAASSPTMTAAASAPSDLSALLMHSAYGRMRPIAEAIPPEKTRDIQLAVGNMIETMLIAEPQMQKFRPELVKLGDFDMSNLDRLKDCTFALAYMYARVRAASGKLPPSSVATLVANRQLMHRHGIALASSGFFEEAQVNELIKGKSHQDLTYDVIGFTNLFLDKGSELDGHTPLKRPQLIAMQAEATAMLSVIGEKDSRRSERAELSPLYRQLYTLAFNTYNEVRDALIYALRKRPDAEDLLRTVAPSLFEDRGRRVKANKPAEPQPAEVDDEDDDVPGVPAIPTPAPITDSATNTAAARTAAIRESATREPAARETRPGFPGSSPTVPEEDDK